MPVQHVLELVLLTLICCYCCCACAACAGIGNTDHAAATAAVPALHLLGLLTLTTLPLLPLLLLLCLHSICWDAGCDGGEFMLLNIFNSLVQYEGPQQGTLFDPATMRLLVSHGCSRVFRAVAVVCLLCLPSPSVFAPSPTPPHSPSPSDPPHTFSTFLPPSRVVKMSWPCP